MDRDFSQYYADRTDISSVIHFVPGMFLYVGTYHHIVRKKQHVYKDIICSLPEREPDIAPLIHQV